MEEREAELRDQSRQGGWPQRDRKIAALQLCLATAETLRHRMMEAEREMEVGNTFDDEQAALKDDIVASLEWRIKELR